jgi:pimeloyl-ACP methyl ester carboxylesterase
VESQAASRIVTLDRGPFPIMDIGTGPAVLLLHGFPDSRHVWRHVAPVLVSAGFRVIAPDLLGFGDAPRPAEARHYRRALLILDVINLLDALGIAKTHIVGHDCGAALTWRLAGSYADRFDRVAALSVGSTGNAGWTTLAQRQKSWYFDFFLKAGIAEQALQQHDWQLFRDWADNQGGRSVAQFGGSESSWRADGRAELVSRGVRASTDSRRNATAIAAMEAASSVGARSLERPRSAAARAADAAVSGFRSGHVAL